jgi:hypothetical protein
MASSRSSVNWAAGSGKTVGREGANEALNAGVGSGKLVRYPKKNRGLACDEKPLELIVYPALRPNEVGLRSMVSDFPVLHPAFWLRIFRGALPGSTLGSLGLWLGDSSISGSALGSLLSSGWGFRSSSKGPLSLPMCSVGSPC